MLRKGGKTRALPLEDFFIAYGKQDRAPGEFVAGGRGAAARGRISAIAPSRSRSASTRTSPPSCWRLASTLTDGRSPARASPTAAWRRRRSARRTRKRARRREPRRSRDLARRARGDRRRLHAAHRHARDRRLSDDGRRKSAREGAHRNRRRERADPDRRCSMPPSDD